MNGTDEEQMFNKAKNAVALDYHYSKQLVFWSDNMNHRIYSYVKYLALSTVYKVS